MVSNLFQHQSSSSIPVSSTNTETLTSAHTNNNNTTSSSATSAANKSNISREQGRRDARVHASSDVERCLFEECVMQIQRNLKSHLAIPSGLHTLASYYTKIEPYIDHKPFCVALSYATFLFHLQMARISVTDVEAYVELVANVLSQLREDEQLRHPFVLHIIRDRVFGLPSPTSHGGVHNVVLIPPPQYRGFAVFTTSLLKLNVIPLQIVYQFQERLEYYCGVSSPIVANRALALLVQCVSHIRIDEQIRALQYVLRTKPSKINVDFLLACYERLKRAVHDPAHGPSFGRALSIHCSELFLRFHSPIRRHYVENYLYPSLCNEDMTSFLTRQATRTHLITELLVQCTPNMATCNPYYMCLCALMQFAFDDETNGAIEIVNMMNCRMPHAAYFMSTLAIDAHMSVNMFAKVILALTRGVGLVMRGHSVNSITELNTNSNNNNNKTISKDEVAVHLRNNRTSVYNVLFTLREIVRVCATTLSTRSREMLTALRIAISHTTVEALGKLCNASFDTHNELSLHPQLLCAELAMVLHEEHIDDAIQSAVSYFNDVTQQCAFCGLPRSSSLLCAVNNSVHVSGHASLCRVLSTLTECANSNVLVNNLIAYLRDPATQMNSGVHFFIYHLLAHAGPHRNELFISLEPYIRSTLMTLISADHALSRSNHFLSNKPTTSASAAPLSLSNNEFAMVSSTQKASVLMLHVKLSTLLSSTIDPTYLESLIHVFNEVVLRSNHDALALWYVCNVMLRHCRQNIDLQPIDPQESNYCVNYPGCAPESAACADNAQRLLRLLDKTHKFSPQMRKLVGCCVCKLIQDFNMQAPNIAHTLLSSFGFMPVGLESLNEFALPVGAGSTFWNFVINQMKSSSPARTAFMAALARSIASRFRIASPADAVTLHGSEETAHLFAMMVYEAIKRHSPLARIILFMMSSWMKQHHRTPGKFVCLVYICIQLITTILDRGNLPSPVELSAETQQDRSQFEECVLQVCRALHTQESRLVKLGEVVQQNNVQFYYLVRRLQRKLRRTTSAAEGTPFDEEAEFNEELHYIATEHTFGPEQSLEEQQTLHESERTVETNEAAYEGSSIDRQQTEDERREHGMSTHEADLIALSALQQAADNSVFNDYHDNLTDATDTHVSMSNAHATAHDVMEQKTTTNEQEIPHYLREEEKEEEEEEEYLEEEKEWEIEDKRNETMKEQLFTEQEYFDEHESQNDKNSSGNSNIINYTTSNKSNNTANNGNATGNYYRNRTKADNTEVLQGATTKPTTEVAIKPLINKHELYTASKEVKAAHKYYIDNEEEEQHQEPEQLLHYQHMYSTVKKVEPSAIRKGAEESNLKSVMSCTEGDKEAAETLTISEKTTANDNVNMANNLSRSTSRAIQTSDIIDTLERTLQEEQAAVSSNNNNNSNGHNDKEILHSNKYDKNSQLQMHVMSLNNTECDDTSVRGSDETAAPHCELNEHTSLPPDVVPIPYNSSHSTQIQQQQQQQQVMKERNKVHNTQVSEIDYVKLNNDIIKDKIDLQRTPSQIRGTTWYEPDLSNLLGDGDTTPIDDPALPQLQVSTTSNSNANPVIPSGLVLEYLRTHQEMDSLRDEMHQLSQTWLLQQQQVNALMMEGQNENIYNTTTETSRYAIHPGNNAYYSYYPAHLNKQSNQAEQTEQGPTYAMQTVTMAGKVNNYNHPHHSAALLAPNTTITTAVEIHPTNTSTSVLATGDSNNTSSNQYAAVFALNNTHTNNNNNNNITDVQTYYHQENVAPVEVNTKYDEVVDGEHPITPVSEAFSPVPPVEQEYLEHQQEIPYKEQEEKKRLSQLKRNRGTIDPNESKENKALSANVKINNNDHNNDNNNSSHLPHGMRFFMQQNTHQGASTVTQEILREVQTQRGMDVFGTPPPPILQAHNLHATHNGSTSNTKARNVDTDNTYNGANAVPHNLQITPGSNMKQVSQEELLAAETQNKIYHTNAFIGNENLPPTTPFGQMIIPACFVEQKNDTTMCELRQIMGAYQTNDSRLYNASSTHERYGKNNTNKYNRAEYVHTNTASEITPAHFAVAMQNKNGGNVNSTITPSNDNTNNNNNSISKSISSVSRQRRSQHTGPTHRGSSGPWWSEMSAAPMPEYAADTQYSMELF